MTEKGLHFCLKYLPNRSLIKSVNTVVYIVCFAIVSLSLKAQDTIKVDENTAHLYIAKKCLHASHTKELDVDSFRNYKQVIENNHRLTSNEYNVLKTVIQNTGHNDIEMLCFLHNVQIDRASIEMRQDNKVVYVSPITGCTIPLADRPNAHRTLALPLSLRKHQIYDLYIKVYRKEFGITVTPHLVNPIYGFDFLWTDYSFFLIIISNLILAVFGIAIALHGRIKRLDYTDAVAFVWYAIITNAYILAASGYGSMYVWSGCAWFEVNAAIFFGALSGATFMWMCKRILGINKINKWLGRWIDFVAITYIVVTIPGFWLYKDAMPVGMYPAMLSLSYLLLLINMLFIIGLTIKKALVDGNKLFYWFLAIFFFYIIYTVLVMMLELGIMRYNFQMHAKRVVLTYFPQLIVLLIFMVKNLTKAINDKKLNLEKLSRSVTQDIHDELGTTFTKMSLHAHMAGIKSKNDTFVYAAKKIEDNAIEANIRLREFLNGINPEPQSWQEFVQKIQDVHEAALQRLGCKGKLFHSTNSRSLLTESDIKKTSNDVENLLYILTQDMQITDVILTLKDAGIDSIAIDFSIKYREGNKLLDSLKESPFMNVLAIKVRKRALRNELYWSYLYIKNMSLV